MLAKLTVKNQLTLPKAIVSRFSGVEYYDVSTEVNRIFWRKAGKSRWRPAG